MTDKLVIYTGIFGGYDRLREPKEPFAGCDFICFTDDPALESSVWKIVHVSQKKMAPAALNRRYKMLPHHYLGQYFYSLYVDGNIRIVRNPRDLVDKYLTRYCIAIPPHPDRSCVYDEVRACIEMGVLRASDVEAQIEEYAENGFPVNAGLWENNVILRKHNEPSVVRLMEDWWREYKEKSKRDQISLPYLRWKHGIEIGEIAEGPRVSSKYFSIGLHASDLDAGWIRKVSRYALANRHRRLMYRAMAQFVSLGISFRKRMLQRVRFKKRGICQ